MTGFTAKRDDGRSLWRVAYDYLVGRITDRTLTPGDVVSHSEMSYAMGVDSSHSAYYQAVLRASRQLEKDHGRCLVSERGEGYRLVAGRAMTDAGLVHHTKSRKQMDIAVRTVNAVRFDDLDSMDERTVLGKIRVGLAMAGAVLSMQAEKIAEHDDEIAALKSQRLDDKVRAQATEQEITDIRERLRLLEDQAKGQ